MSSTFHNLRIGHNENNNKACSFIYHNRESTDQNTFTCFKKFNMCLLCCHVKPTQGHEPLTQGS